VSNVSAIQALKDSLARPSGTPCTWREDRDVYIAEQTAALLERVIEPVTVRAVANDWAQKYVPDTDGAVRSFLAVARHEEKWLLFDPNSGTFSLAHGSAESMPLGLLGFASPDALAEWLG
jgi:hypothetical protein